MRHDRYFVCLRGTGGLRHDGSVEPAPDTRLGSDGHFLYGESNNYQLWRKQCTRLGDERGDERCHHTGYIHLGICERFDEREPDGDHDLYVDRDE